MPSCTATGTSSGPKMISAAAPSSTAPMTIRMAIDSSRNSQAPLLPETAIIASASRCGTCCKVSMNASD